MFRAMTFESFLSCPFPFDWVGVLWPQLSKVLKLVRWARRAIAQRKTSAPLCRYTVVTRKVPFKLVQELCESRGGRPGLSILTNLLVSAGVKLY